VQAIERLERLAAHGDETEPDKIRPRSQQHEAKRDRGRQSEMRQRQHHQEKRQAGPAGDEQRRAPVTAKLALFARDVFYQQAAAALIPEGKDNADQRNDSDERAVAARAQGARDDHEVHRLDDEPQTEPTEHPKRSAGHGVL
jgi:hypothetical protein